ncbi:unnamed protein product [Albugo candida]|uniref:Uncharacterized protein n=1 Tax=Albugo candida TaxID=65357 RepID=A0A024GFU5_9STRA|nr:unnamed protein product [Albugo candida]|eukprot:CCI45214.1 unnamed protein product [Albugo candida]
MYSLQSQVDEKLTSTIEDEDKETDKVDFVADRKENYNRQRHSCQFLECKPSLIRLMNIRALVQAAVVSAGSYMLAYTLRLYSSKEDDLIVLIAFLHQTLSQFQWLEAPHFPRSSLEHLCCREKDCMRVLPPTSNLIYFQREARS